MLGGAGSPGGDELLTVVVLRDEHGYGMKVSGDNPVYVQSVKEAGAAWRAGLRAGDRIEEVNGQNVFRMSHQQVVLMIKANPVTRLIVRQSARNKTMNQVPITGPRPVNSEKQRQVQNTKVHTFRMMLEKEQKYIRDLKNELSKVPDVRKQAELESAEMRCAKLQREIDTLACDKTSPEPMKTEKPMSPQNSSFLSGIPRSLSNLTGQSLKNLRQTRRQPPLIRQNSDENGKKRHNNTVPIVPTTCLDNVSPPPLPPRSIERPKPLNPMAKPFRYPNKYPYPPRMHQSMPSDFGHNQKNLRRSSHSLDGELDGPQPNSIALQMSYPLVNVPPPSLQMDNRASMPPESRPTPVHVRSQSSPEHLDRGQKSMEKDDDKMRDWWEVYMPPPPGTPPPPYVHNTQPCADPQRSIISMEDDDSPASDNSTYSGLFSNVRAVLQSKARMAVLLNWLLAEKRCACANLFLLITDGYRNIPNVNIASLRRWAYEIHSTFLMPNALMPLNGVDENMANEIEQVLENEHESEDLLRNVFRKARQKAKDELTRQLTEFQVKRQVGLSTFYGPEDAVLEKCDVDKIQEQTVVEQLVSRIMRDTELSCGGSRAALLLRAAIATAAGQLSCRPATIAALMSNNNNTSRSTFLQIDKHYKQKVKHLTKQQPQPFIVRGHHLTLMSLTSVCHCHHCANVICGLAPQAYVCTVQYCDLRVHLSCARSLEESCVVDGEHHTNRISRLLERIHADSTEKKSKKASDKTSNFLNMERNSRRAEEEAHAEVGSAMFNSQGDSKREGSSEEPPATEGDADVTDVKDQHDKDNSKQKQSPRGVTRAESCRERDTPHSRRGKQRNASDPNRLTAPDHGRDLEASAATAPSGSSSSSSLSSRSNESNTPADHQGSQSEMSEDEEPLCSVWTESIAPEVLDSLSLSPRLRKRQEVIHELIVSEQSHVRWLKVLLHIFAKPLQKTRLLPSEEVRELFPNLPAVRERHLKLLQDLMALRSSLMPVPIGPLASAVSKTLSSPTYANCLSKFCGGQRRALDRLRERRRKNKELHQFLLAREQMPQCGRLQLRDLLACVWQRLTKYQLLLENIVRSVSAEDDPSEVELLRGALHTAKSVLNAVDSAVRQKENEHRLKSIQSKLEVRGSQVTGTDLEELRKLDLHKHQLTMEGELTLRCDTKKTTVTALMLSECLVLLHREGDKYILKHIATQAASTLSPIIKWRNVLFRPNAAVKNTFFLMNINGVQMHELSTNTAAEYATWSRHIQEAPLAEARATRPVPQTLRTQDEQVGGGTSVSRNPSDASEKSQECPRDTPEPATETPPAPAEDSSSQHTNDEAPHEEREERKVGSISTHNAEPPPPLEDSTMLRVHDPAVLYEAITAVSPEEQLRRLDETIAAAMAEKNRIVCTVLGIPADCYPEVAEIAVADTLGHVDVRGELGVSKPDVWEEDDMQQLLLAAQQQAAQLTERISRAISSDVNHLPNVRSSRSLCDTCNDRIQKDTSRPLSDAMDTSVNKDSFDMLSDCDLQQQESARALAARLLSPCSVIESSISRLLALSGDQHRMRTLRLHSRETADLRAHRTLLDFQDVPDDDLPPDDTDTSADAGSNGG